MGLGRKLKKGIKKYGKYINPQQAFGLDPKGTAKGFAKDLGFSSGDPDNSASKLRAKIAREQWEDYKTRFQPLENVLLGYAGDREGYVKKAQEGAVNRVNQAYSTGQGQAERRLQSYGLNVTPQLQQRIASKLGLQKGLATVQASNLAKRQANEEITGIVGGGLSLGPKGTSFTEKAQVG